MFCKHIPHFTIIRVIVKCWDFKFAGELVKMEAGGGEEGFQLTAH